MVLMGSCFSVAKAVLSMRADIILLGGCTHKAYRVRARASGDDGGDWAEGGSEYT